MGTSKMFCDQINLHSRDRLKTWCVLCSVIIVQVLNATTNLTQKVL